jgi:hypothetical protein
MFRNLDAKNWPAEGGIASKASIQALLRDGNIEGRGNSLLSEHTDETGYTVRRYNFMSRTEERRVLDELSAQGIKVDVLADAARALGLNRFKQWILSGRPEQTSS